MSLGSVHVKFDVRLTQVLENNPFALIPSPPGLTVVFPPWTITLVWGVTVVWPGRVEVVASVVIFAPKDSKQEIWIQYIRFIDSLRYYNLSDLLKNVLITIDTNVQVTHTSHNKKRGKERKGKKRRGKQSKGRKEERKGLDRQETLFG